MTPKLITIIGSSMLIFSLSGALAWGKDFTNFGRGSESCATWTADRKAKKALGDEQWVLGFVSATGDTASADGNKNVNINTDADGIFSWIDDYCKANPTDDIATAGDAFWTKSGTVELSD
jgi:hypothetical protein